MSGPSEHPFDTDTRCVPVGDGSYHATLTDRWNALGGTPNGGYMLAVCLRALQHELPLPDPLVVSASFLRPGLPGPADVETEVVRTGRSVATGESRLLQGGEEVVRVVGTFSALPGKSGDNGDGHEADGTSEAQVFGQMPQLPVPDEALDPLGGGSIPGVTIVDRVEYRMADVPGWFTGAPSGRPHAEFWMRFKEPRAADALALALLVDAAAPAVMDLGAGGSSTVELTVHVRRHPAPGSSGWLACRASTRFVAGGFHEEDFEIWDASGHLVAQSRQLAKLPQRTRRSAVAAAER